MIDEILIVARKEFIETLTNPKSRRQTLITLVVTVAIVDVAPAFLIQRYWPNVGIAFALALFSLVITPMMTTADSIAGERERHTLETLLATRLSDTAIVLGKILALVTISVGSALLMLFQAIIVLSAIFGNWGAVPLLLAAILGVTLVGVVASVFLCSIGVLVSMRAQTVQGAQQALAFTMMPLFMLPGLAMPLLGTERVLALLDSSPQLPPLFLIGLVALAILGLDVMLLALVARAFRRPRVMKS